MIFPDTDVMIDVWRQHEPAVAWLGSLGDEPIELSGFVAGELMQGCQNKADLERISAFIDSYQCVWPESATCERALTNFGKYHLSHGLGLIDALIAQTAMDHGVPLHTFNVKHYECLPGLRMVQPYERSAT